MKYITRLCVPCDQKNPRDPHQTELVCRVVLCGICDKCGCTIGEVFKRDYVVLVRPLRFEEDIRFEQKQPFFPSATRA